MKFMDILKTTYRNMNFWNLLRNRASLTVSEAETGLQSVLPRSKPKFSQKNVIDPVYDVMIIIPVYNVQEYLDQCIDSVLAQKTKYSFQAVFINDGATDCSGAILSQRITEPHRVITQANQGVSAARNAALRHITGRYVLFLDSDDYIAVDTVEKLVTAIEKKHADIVEAGHCFLSAAESVFRHGGAPCQIAVNELYGFPWGKLIRSELLADFCFPEGFLFEDTVMATLLCPKCKSVVSLPDILYYYRDNTAGITHTSLARKEAVDTFWLMKYCLEERLYQGQMLGYSDYERYLVAVWRNYERTKALTCETQECIFVLTCDLFETYLPFHYNGKQRKMLMLEKALRQRSFAAFQFIVRRWDVL